MPRGDAGVKSPLNKDMNKFFLSRSRKAVACRRRLLTKIMNIQSCPLRIPGIGAPFLSRADSCRAEAK
jgi:hypothetical protein